MAINFGTSGWRAVLSEDFTFANVRRLTAAIAAHVKENPEFGIRSKDYREMAPDAGDTPVVIVGYDPRFMGDDFAKEVALTFAAHGVRAVLADSDTPTPVVAWTILDRKAIGGVVITASHNPGHYNGMKWSPYWGGPATEDVTEDIERRLSVVGHHHVRTVAWDKAERDAWVTKEDLRKPYLKHLKTLLDLKKIKAAKLKIGVDSMHGAARNYLRPFLEDLGLQVEGINEERDVLFGGHSPEPAPEKLGELTKLMKKKKLNLGFACDGDADRFGILDQGGEWVSANDVLGLALHHLVTHRGAKGSVARSLMTSHFVDAVAKAHDLRVRETPVGFKHIGELLRSGTFALGGEESGGLSIGGHVPEKDGLLACLLMLELVAYEKKPLAKIRDQLFKQVGGFYNVRQNFELAGPAMLKDLNDRMSHKPPLMLAGTPVWRIDQADGYKFILKDGRWMGLRFSGTEPVVRLYVEAFDKKGLQSLHAEGKKIIAGKK
jgi:alpha-D-glucose phosphate-specific phosphoglucomutase